MFDLMDRVQGKEGYYALFGIHKDGHKRQKLYASREEFDAKATQLSNTDYNVFFGVAKYINGHNRTKFNVESLKAIWVDLDCGDNKFNEGKGYLTQRDAIVALRQFCKVAGMPKPIIVDSGYGIHAYWAFTQEISRHDWEPIAARLKAVCKAQQLVVDAAVFDASRVLRIPGTLNLKQDKPKEVRILCDGEVVTVEVLRSILGVSDIQPPKQEMTALQKALSSNIEFSFSKIMVKSAKGEGCKQLLDQFIRPDSVSEPSWFDALSIANKCKDRDTAIHKISKGYKNYSPDATEIKATNTKYPHTCETFESNNPEGCKGCKWQGKIKTPLSLGKVIEESEAATVIPVQPIEDISTPEFGVNPSHEIAPDIAAELDESESDGESRIPEYPFPFFRGKNGGVYIRSDDNEAACLYEHDLYVVKRMRDPNPEVGELALLRIHLPMDGAREFSVPLSVVSVKEKLREVLAINGAAILPSNLGGVLHYIMASIKELQYKKRAEQMRVQFGWADKDTSFIIGDKDVRSRGMGYCPPSGTTKELVASMQTKGTFEKWKEVFNIYNTPGLEPNAFAALTAFGAPLLRFTGHNGAIINLIHPESGTGKSTALYMCNSVYGHPVKLTAIWKDTLAAKMIHLGIMNNLPFTCDELTNMTAADFSTLTYSMSQGRGPNRAKSSANEMRINNTTWQTISLATSNASFYEKLGAHKSTPDGEMMRLLEYQIKPSTVIPADVAKQMFDHQLRENYGHAGLVYCQHLVNNLEEVTKGLMAVQQKIDRDAQLTARERFWSAVIACNIAGGLIANKLGIINWDMKRIYQWSLSMLKTLREDATPPISYASHIIGEFISANINGLLIVNGDEDNRTGLQSAPIREPRGELVARFEPDSQALYINSKAFRKYCAENQISSKDTLRSLTESGEYLGTTSKRMAKGMGVNVPAMSVMVFNCDGFGLADIDAIEETLLHKEGETVE